MTSTLAAIGAAETDVDAIGATEAELDAADGSRKKQLHCIAAIQNTDAPVQQYEDEHDESMA